ncbi:PPOX class F420-dependent oxidoreductase [Halomarina halobia]|uniref:PPOX class F420-dependent oxidoreductase n=1 Tax=Halomarina halobia TaxID=3033386 RepID=A0ABD6ABF8_9EURY|nr:PPOX class F420-dependent oxidoreductase [Halomarina sp. PSR21]
MAIPQEFHDLFEKRTFAHVATVMPDGTPQVTPVWVDYDADAEELLVNTARGRLKERNVSRDPKVGVSLVDPDDPYRFVSVRGRVTDLQEERADEHINELAKRYMGVDEYPNRDAESGARVIVRISTDHVATA